MLAPHHVPCRKPSVLLGIIMALAVFAAACEWSEESVESNGEDGELFLGHATEVGNPCGSGIVAPPCDYASGCGITSLITGFHDLQASRWVRVKSGNGLGDSNAVSEYRDLGPTDQIAVEISPTSAATVEDVEVCNDAVRFGLTIHGLAAFDLTVTTEQYEDRWHIDSVAGCEECKP
jgi:hypothetical protein